MEFIPIKPNLNIKTFHIDGLGCQPDGTGSVCNWIRTETWVQRMYQINGLTDHEAEYQALLEVLKYLALGSRATICTHSHEVWWAFNGTFPVRDQELAKLFLEARQLIRGKTSRSVSATFFAETIKR
jgi:ribonuclease HI